MSVRKQILAGLVSAATVAGWTSAALAQPGTPPANIVATVNGSPITMAEVELVLKKAGPKATAPTEAQRKEMQQEALTMLIDDQLMRDFLRKKGPTVDLEEVNKQVAELAESLKKEKKTLADYLKEQNQTEAQLRNDINGWLQWNAFVKQQVTEADLKHYYDESKEFFDRVVVRASHIVLRISPEAPAAEREAIKAKLQTWRKDIVEGKVDFAKAAKDHSQCTSAPNGGDIGFFPRKLAVEEPFAKAAFALKVGDISDVVQTDFGYHLIKVTERKAGTPSDFTKIKDEVRELLVEELRVQILAEQRKTAKVDVNLSHP
ncbi:MAG TPA: peptidylprolyl isomerase [Gemmataceae bacterium]|jgi:peptidyl-prolyl cis-trans isomerase C|nr:peptidylprolyl isomerase [Gemmataceae bacterium]